MEKSGAGFAGYDNQFNSKKVTFGMSLTVLDSFVFHHQSVARVASEEAIYKQQETLTRVIITF